jgi:hypothetical protein
VRAIITLEGISLQLEPDFEIFAVSAPYAARMMLTYPDPALRKRLLDELLTSEGGLDWERLDRLASLAASDNGFHLETEGLAEPAIDLLLSPEGASLRTALVNELLKEPESSASHLEGLAPLLLADQSVSGQLILDRVVAFLLSPDGEETRDELFAGLRDSSNGNGGQGLDLSRAMELASMAGRLHPEFRASSLVRAIGGYLLSEEGKPARNQMLMSSAQWVLDGVLGQLNRLAAPEPPPAKPAVPAEGEGPAELEAAAA